MSRVHIVKSGDTLRKIAILYYGDERKNLILRKANPEITNYDLIYPGQKIIVPGLADRKVKESASKFTEAPEKIEVSPETIDSKTGDSNEIAILIDGEPFKLWTDASINFSFDSIGDEFSLSTPWRPDIERYRKVFKPYTYRECAIYIGGDKILTGEVVTPGTRNGKDSSILSISGYSLPGRLATVNASPTTWPLEFSGLNLFEIAADLAEPFGILVIGEGDPGAKFSKEDKVTMEADQKIYDFLIGLARQRGFVLSSDFNGNMLIRKTTEESSGVAIRHGIYPWLGSDAAFDGNARFSDVTAISTNNKKGAGKKITITDPELKNNGIIRPLVYKASDVSSGGLGEAATARMGRDIAKSFSLGFSVAGWHNTDNVLYRDNQLIFYQSDYDMIYNETEFLIRNANLTKKSNSTETSLTLVFPECYNGKIRGGYPWDI